MKQIAELQKNADAAAALLKHLANPQRLMILCYMVEEPQSVNSIVARVGLSQSAVSQHLARLREAGLVTTSRKAQSVYYQLADEHARRVLEVLYALYCGNKNV